LRLDGKHPSETGFELCSGDEVVLLFIEEKKRARFGRVRGLFVCPLNHMGHYSPVVFAELTVGSGSYHDFKKYYQSARLMFGSGELHWEEIAVARYGV